MKRLLRRMAPPTISPVKKLDKKVKTFCSVGAFATLLFASGCAVHEPDVASLNAALTDAAWSHTPAGDAAAAPDPERFWAGFGDERLVALVKRASASGADVKTALANVRAARALVTGTFSALWPSGSASLGASQADATRDGAKRFTGDAGLTYALNLGGREYRLDQAAELDAAASLLTLADVRNVVAAEVAQNYFYYRWSQELALILKAGAQNYRETADLARWRYEAGLGSAADAEDALTQWNNAQAQLADVEKSAQEYVNALSRLTLMKRSDVEALLASGPSVLPQLPAETIASVPADTLRRRPDVRSAELALRAAAYRISAAKAAFFPTLSLSGDLGVEAATLPALGSAKAIANVAGSLGMTILNWGALASQTEQQKAEFDRLEAAYESTVAQALEAADNASTALKQSQVKKTWLTDAVTHAANAQELASLEYETGNGDYQQLLSTQRSLLSTRQSLLQNEADALNAYVQLYRALGGGWNVPAEAQKDKNNEGR